MKNKPTIILLFFGLTLKVVFGFLAEIPRNILQYEFVQPIKIRSSYEKNGVKTNQTQVSEHDNFLKIQIQTEKNLLHLVLKKNDLFNRKRILVGHYKPTEQDDFEDCHYHGEVRRDFVNVGSAVITTCDGLTGTIYDEEENTTYYLNHLTDTKQHILYKSTDLVGAPDVVYNDIPQQINIHSNLKKFRQRRTLISSLQKTRYVIMAIVADKSFFESRMNNIKDVTRFIASVINHVDFIYQLVNIRIALSYVEIWSDKDKFAIQTDMGANLANFATYNRETLIGKYKWNHDNAHLLTSVTTGDVIGLAGIGSLCSETSEAVSRVWHQNPSLVANTVGHEFGHNFGMAHDNDKCTCNKAPCLMTSYVSWSTARGFSDCSQKVLEERCSKGFCQCLDDQPGFLFGGSKCGNGFVEQGEECDCGPVTVCQNPCCNAITCKLRFGECAHGECCHNCRLLKKGHVCRNNQTECDITEICDGVNPTCPTDTYIEDYSICDNGKSYCHGGYCIKSLDDQCRYLWGPAALHGSEKYCGSHMNTNGDEWGNCGKDISGNYQKCLKGDSYCGKLQCHGDNLPNWILFGSGRQTKIYWSSVKCRSGETSIGRDVEDPTLAKHGTKCDIGKVCHQRKCVDINFVHNTQATCHEKCGNNGHCTNTGRCYCLPGYNCPDCIQKDNFNIHGIVCNDILNSTVGAKTCQQLCVNGGICKKETGTCICPKGKACPYCQDNDLGNNNGNLLCQPVTYADLKCGSKFNGKFEKIGCVNKMSKKTTGSFIANYRDKIIWQKGMFNLNELVCMCASAGSAKGFNYIAIQFWGECWGSNDYENIRQLGSHNDCATVNYTDCSQTSDICGGRNDASFVYRIENWSSSKGKSKNPLTNKSVSKENFEDINKE